MNFSLLRSVAKIWHFFADAWPVIWLCRFSVFSILLGLVILVGVDQAREALMRMAQSEMSDRLVSHAYLCWFATLWAMGNWYSARLLLQMRFPQTPARTIRLELWARLLPRWAGAGVYFVIATGFAYAWFAANTVGTVIRLALGLSVAAYIALGFLFVFTVSHRRGRNQFPTPSFREAFSKGDQPVVDDTTGYFAIRSTVSAIPNVKKLLSFWFGITVSFFILFSWWPLSLPSHIGAVSIFAAAIAAWIPFGSVMVWLSDRFRVPLFALLAAFAIAISFTRANDNHFVRPKEGASKTLLDQRPLMMEFVRGWLLERRAEIQQSELYPVVFVAAPGGGARAAYWTAGVLGDIHDACPRAARHIVAASGVSGGSLGLLLHMKATGPSSPAHLSSTPKCAAFASRPDTAGGPTRSGARKILGEDFIAPTLATMLFPDLTHQITLIGAWLGFAFPPHFTDRGVTLERAWERAYQKANPNDRGLDEGFLETMPAKRYPILLLNGTSVETGKRLVMSNIRVGHASFGDAIDVLPIIQSDVRLSTAAHFSARFTYVSPPGVLKNANGERWGHVVDGGYFENSGASEILSVMQAFYQCLDNLPGCGLKEMRPEDLRKILPIVLYLPNDPERQLVEPAANQPPPPNYALGLNDLLSPLHALLHTREARANFAENSADQFVSRRGGYFAIVSPYKEQDGVELPLGWTMSPMVLDEMDKQIVARRLQTGALIECVRNRSTESCSKYQPSGARKD